MQGLMHYSIFIDIFTLASKIRGQKQIRQKTKTLDYLECSFFLIYNINSLLVLGNRVRQYDQIQS